MAKQKILGGFIVLVGIAVTAPASAQTTPNSTRPAQTPPQATARFSPPPPAVRRQPPRAAELPSRADDPADTGPDREALDDEALNRKISGICRGC